VPVYKGKGDQAGISSYRPLSVPTVACRVWSSLTNKALMDATSVTGTEGVLPDTMFVGLGIRFIRHLRRIRMYAVHTAYSVGGLVFRAVDMVCLQTVCTLSEARRSKPKFVRADAHSVLSPGPEARSKA
jgi:hypothetical protein